jgi:3-oxoadipate enol-lactonase
MSDAVVTTPNDGFDFVIAEPGVEFSVQRSGEGPTVLLVGGLGMPSITWDICRLPRSLVDAGFEVIAYNTRGLSPSSAPAAPYSVADLAGDAAAILDHFQVGQATVVGYSMGCYTAQALLRSRPDQVRALVLLAGLQPSPLGAMVGEMELGLIERYGELPPESARSTCPRSSWHSNTQGRHHDIVHRLECDGSGEVLRHVGSRRWQTIHTFGCSVVAGTTTSMRPVSTS